MSAPLLFEREGSIARLRFNRPEVLNAADSALALAFRDACRAIEADPAVRVVVLHGAGGQSFAAGADISEFEQHRANAEQKRLYAETASRAHRGLARLDKPLIAMVQGFCIGGGLALALAADLRFAAQGSRFGIPAARLGLGYEYEGLAALARVVGPSAAKDLLFSARQLEADEALRLGLVNHLLPAEELEPAVRAYAARVAANAPLTVQAAKAAVRLFERYSAADDSAVAAAVDRCFDSADYQEGRRAFMEKRNPVFEGR